MFDNFLVYCIIVLVLAFLVLSVVPHSNIDYYASMPILCHRDDATNPTPPRNYWARRSLIWRVVILVIVVIPPTAPPSITSISMPWSIVEERRSAVVPRITMGIIIRIIINVLEQQQVQWAKWLFLLGGDEHGHCLLVNVILNYNKLSLYNLWVDVCKIASSIRPQWTAV